MSDTKIDTWLIEAHSESTAMTGDRMDTGLVAGIEAGLETFLVLTGSTLQQEIRRFPFRPGMPWIRSQILSSLSELLGCSPRPELAGVIGSLPYVGS